MAYWASIRPALLSIRTKLTLPYILLAILIAAGGGMVVSRVGLNSLDERFTNQLIETRKLAADFTGRQESDLLETLRLLSHVQGIGQAIRASDTRSIIALIYPITFNARQDAVLVLDPQGNILLAILRSDETGQYDLPELEGNLTGLPFVEKVVSRRVDPSGDKFAGISYADWGNYLFIAGPVKDERGDFVGVVMVGASLDRTVRQMHDETLSQVTIYDSSLHSRSTTFPEVPATPAVNVEAVLTSDDTHAPVRDLVVRDVSYSELLGPLTVRGGEKIGALGTALPRTFLMRTTSITRFNITAITILAILLAMLFGISLSDWITRPIRKLKQAATQVSGGNLRVQVDARGGDEVAVLAQSFNTMVTHLRESEENLVAAYDKTIEGWAKALELRDRDTLGHTQRVAELTLRLAKVMEIGQPALDNIRRGALLHDIGKMGISDTILLKAGRLTDQEWTIMRQHPAFAREMLVQIEFLRPAMDIPCYHHEKWDGTGYPYGMAGKEIPLAARVFAVIDVWDALTSDRPYRKAWPEERALQYIRENAGTHFDPEVARVFLENQSMLRSVLEAN